MSISIKPYTYKFTNYANWALRKIANKVPSFTVDSERAIKNIKWIGKHISSPENRLILGVSAIMSQPFIDLHNKRVDEETRKTSAARTVAKIIAGTSTGVLVRWGSIKLIEMMTKVPQKNRQMKWWETLFSPDRTRTVYKSLGHYKNAIGTILAMVIMVFTNFAIDAPLTKYLTNKFIAGIKKKDDSKNTSAPIQPSQQQNPFADSKPKTTKDGSTNLIKIKVEELQNSGNNKASGGTA